MKIKNTKSLCPECGKPLKAEVFDNEGKIFIKKTCDEHGEFVNTYWGNCELYNRVEKYSPSITSVENPCVDDTGVCPSNCGLCSKHETSTVLGLIDVTNRCNLRCPVCFANATVSGYLYEPTQDEIRQMLRNLRNLKPNPCSAIQFSGGEPTVRKDILDLIRIAKEEGFTHIQIATNGIMIAKREKLAFELKKAGLNTVYLSFEGITPEPYIENKGRNLLPDKLQAIENCKKADLGVVLVPTVVRGVNDNQIGEIIKFAFDNNEIIYGINFQPVFFSGRTSSDCVEEQRITISDFVEIVENETGGQVPTSAFYPPSFVEPVAEFISLLNGEKSAKVTLNCHEHCGIGTYVFREKIGGDGKDKFIPITEFIDVDELYEKLIEYNEKLKSGGFGSREIVLASLIKTLAKVIHTSKAPNNLDIRKTLYNLFAKGDYAALGDFSKNAMLISCMHFMDPFNFDEDRVKKCVIHYSTPDGRIIPCCTMNSIYRESIEREFSKPLNR